MVKRLWVNHTDIAEAGLGGDVELLAGVGVVRGGDAVVVGLLGAALEVHAHRGHVRDAIGELGLGRLLGAEGVAGGTSVRGLVGVALLRLILGEVRAGHRGEVQDGGVAAGNVVWRPG